MSSVYRNKYPKTKKTPQFFQNRNLSVDEQITLEMNNFSLEKGFTQEMRTVIEGLLPYTYKFNDHSKPKSKKLNDFYLNNINCRLNQLREMGCTVQGENGQYYISVTSYSITVRARDFQNDMQTNPSQSDNQLNRISNSRFSLNSDENKEENQINNSKTFGNN